MSQGTITLPSGDKLITQTEILSGGALVHREEVVYSGTISDQLALPVQATPAVGTYGIPVYPVTQPIDAAIYAMNATLNNAVLIAGQVDDASTVTVSENKVGATRITPSRALHVNLRNDSGTELGTSGAPVRTDPTGSTTQPVSIAGTVQVAFTPASTQNVNMSSAAAGGTTLALLSEQQSQTTTLSNINAGIRGTIGVNVVNTPAVTFASAQPISTIAGTVQVAFTPSAVQNVSMSTPAAGGTTLALFSEQQSQTTLLTNINAGVRGTTGVNVINTPSITFASAQPISTIAGTVQVAFTPATVQNVNLMNVGFAGTPLRIDPTGTTTQPVSISGTLSIPDYARYSEQQTQSSSLTAINTSIESVQSAVLGTPAVKFASAQSIIFSGQQPVHGTVQVSSLPSVTFASAQPISTVAGTVQVSPIPSSIQNITITTPSAGGTVLALLSEQQSQTTALNNINAGVRGTIGVNIVNTPSVTFSSAQPISTIAGTVTNSIVAIPSLKTAKIDLGTSGNGTIVPLVSGKKLKVYAININADRRGTASLVWLDGATALSGTQSFSDREGFTMSLSPPSFLFATTQGTPVQAHIPAGGNGGLRGWLSYWDGDSN